RTTLSFGPSGGPYKPVSYSYDALSRPYTITNWNSQPLTYTYSGARLNQLNYPNGVVAAYSFDGAGRLLNINQTKGASTIFSATYPLDNLGNRQAISENLNSTIRNLNYLYDELSRLISETVQLGSSQPVTTAYRYDGVGNRLYM